MASTNPSSRKSVLLEVARIGLDLAKRTVHFVGLDATGQVLTRRQYSKGKLLEVTATMGPCRIGMETAVAPITWGARCWARGTTSGSCRPSMSSPSSSATRRNVLAAVPNYCFAG